MRFMRYFDARKSRHWVSTRRLYKVLELSSILGILLPILTILLKLSVNNFENLEQYKASIPVLRYYLSKYPILDISHTLPFLANLSWHHPWDTNFLRFYLRYSIFNFCILILLWFSREKVYFWLGQGVEWLHVDEHRFPRQVVFSVVFVLVATYQIKIPLGFWFPGIGGWTYESWRPQIQTHLSEPPSTEDRIQVERLRFLERAVVPEHAIYLPQKGYLTGKGMFLHYRNGEVLPANYELTDFVFPEYIFGPFYYVFGQLYQGFSRPKVFFQVIKASLSKRNANRRFLLPLSLAYPNHSVYMKINYEKYPPAKSLEKISFWELTIFVDDHRRIQIVKANKEFEVNGQ